MYASRSFGSASRSAASKAKRIFFRISGGVLDGLEARREALPLSIPK